MAKAERGEANTSRTQTVVLNDNGSPRLATSTVDPHKPNLTQQFLRTTQTTTSKLKPKVTNFIQKF